MKPRHPRKSSDHFEIIDYFNRAGDVCSPTRKESFAIANQMIESRTEFRRIVLGSEMVLTQCLAMLTKADDKTIRFDFVFDLSQRETERISQIRESLAPIIRRLTNALKRSRNFCDQHEGRRPSLKTLIRDIELLGIRIGHINQWYRDLKRAVQETDVCETGHGPFNSCEQDSSRRILEEAKPHFDQYVESKQAMARGAMKLVVSIAKRYENPRIPLMDLVQEGNCGLLTAVEKYNPNLGFAFTTYATRWIQQKVLIAVFEKSRTVRLPIVLSRKLADTERDLELLAHASSHFPSEDESKQVAKRQKVVQRLLKIYRNSFVSIHGLVGADGESTRAYELENKCIEQPSTSLHRQRIVKDVKHAIEKLDGQKRTAMEMRFGFYGEPYSNQQIGNEMGISRETVRSLVKESMRILKGDLEHLCEV